MKLAQSFVVPFPRAPVWEFFHDTAAVLRCLPGAELTEARADGSVAGRFAVKLGPLAAAFVGEATIAFDEATFSGTIAGSGADRRSGSRTRGNAQFALVEAEGGTRLDIAIDYTLAGALAQFSRGAIVEDLATRLTAEFAGNLRAALASMSPRDIETPDAATAPAPVDAGKLLLAVFWRRLRGWGCRLLRRA